MRYVVVKHAGFEVAPGDELNGVTFNAVGSGTIVENLEIYSAYDDGVEFFGGAVNITNLVALYVRDDSIDFSDGYVGTVKNALGHPFAAKRQQLHRRRQHRLRPNRQREPGGASTAPLTRPTISHMTCITSNFDVGTHGDSRRRRSSGSARA